MKSGVHRIFDISQLFVLMIVLQNKGTPSCFMTYVQGDEFG